MNVPPPPAAAGPASAANLRGALRPFPILSLGILAMLAAFLWLELWSVDLLRARRLRWGVLAAVLLIVGLYARAKWRGWRFDVPLFIAGAVILLMGFSALWSTHRLLSLAYALAGGAIMIAYLLGARLVVLSEGVRRPAQVMVAVHFALVVLSIAWWYLHPTQAYGELSGFAGIARNPNGLGIFLLLTLPFVLSEAWNCRGARRWALAALALVGIIMVFASQARGSQLALILLAPVVIHFVAPGIVSLRYLSRFGPSALALIAVLVVGLTLAAFGVLGASAQTWYQVHVYGQDTSVLYSRQRVWEHAIAQGLLHPLRGAGFGVLPGQVTYTMEDGTISSGTYETGSSVLLIWIELGVVGVLLVGALIGAHLVRAVHALRSAHPPLRDPRIVCIAGASISVAGGIIEMMFSGWLLSPGSAASHLFLFSLGYLGAIVAMPRHLSSRA